MPDFSQKISKIPNQDGLFLVFKCLYVKQANILTKDREMNAILSSCNLTNPNSDGRKSLSELGLSGFYDSRIKNQ
ncbi:MAG: hypothetical protein HQK65_02880 [Desulfamplus sp.]|nr:hypothetical protein [Desulfamplus sp.]